MHTREVVPGRSDAGPIDLVYSFTELVKFNIYYDHNVHGEESVARLPRTRRPAGERDGERPLARERTRRRAGRGGTGLAPYHTATRGFIFYFKLHVLYKYLILEKNLYIKMYRKDADASTAILGRDANRGTHAHIHNYTGGGARGRRRRNIHKYKL